MAEHKGRFISSQQAIMAILFCRQENINYHFIIPQHTSPEPWHRLKKCPEVLFTVLSSPNILWWGFEKMKIDSLGLFVKKGFCTGTVAIFQKSCYIYSHVTFIKNCSVLKFFSIKFPIKWAIDEISTIILKIFKNLIFNGRSKWKGPSSSC